MDWMVIHTMRIGARRADAPRLHISDVPAGVKAAGVQGRLDEAGWALQFSEAGVAWANHRLLPEPRWPESFASEGRLAHTTWDQLTATTIRATARRITIPATPAIHAQLTLAARAAGLPLVTWALNTLTAAANTPGAGELATNSSAAIAQTPHGPQPNTRARGPARPAGATTKKAGRAKTPAAQPAATATSAKAPAARITGKPDNRRTAKAPTGKTAASPSAPPPDVLPPPLPPPAPQPPQPPAKRPTKAVSAPAKKPAAPARITGKPDNRRTAKAPSGKTAASPSAPPPDVPASAPAVPVAVDDGEDLNAWLAGLAFGPAPERSSDRPAPAAGKTLRYRYLATDGRRLVAGDGASVETGPWTHAGELIDAARQLVADGEVIVAVHPGAHFLLGLPADRAALPEPGADGLRLAYARDAIGPATLVREVGDSAGLIVERPGAARAQIIFPAYSGEFAGAGDVAELAEAIEAFCGALDFGYLYSAASTVHRLIEFTQPRGRRLGPPAEHPTLTPPYAPMGYSVPAAAWSRPLTDAEAARSFVVVCDRNGSFLSAWGSCALADGPWSHQDGPRPLPAGKEPSRPAGYWLMDTAQLAEITPAQLPDPFLRHRHRGDKVWLTTPLAQLAHDLAGDRPLTVYEAWTAERFRPLDEAAKRLAAARTALLADPRPAARVALATVKAGYVAATAWFEFGARPPAPLARPDWRRTIHDRFVANTWRSLNKATTAPFALTDVDAALFALDHPGLPDGLPAGVDLRSWKTKGRPVPMAEARQALDTGGPGAVIALAEKAAAAH